MSFLFDFISDIHQEWWDKAYDYAANKKNDLVVVGGDLSSCTETSIEELKKISAVYKKVLFIDGNHEFRMGPPDYRCNFNVEEVEQKLREAIDKMPNVTYLRDEVYIEGDTAIIGRNGHWDYKIMPEGDRSSAISALAKTLKASFNEASLIGKAALRDYKAICKEVQKLNDMPEIKNIIVVTHTVPRVELLNMSPSFPVEHQNRMGSSLMADVPKADKGRKIKLWLYGHQHASKDVTLDGIRYLQQTRGFQKDGDPSYKTAEVKIK